MKVYRVMASGAAEGELGDLDANDLLRFIIVAADSELPEIAERVPLPADVVHSNDPGALPYVEHYKEMDVLHLKRLEIQGSALRGTGLRCVLMKKMLIIVQNGADRRIEQVLGEILEGFDKFMGAANVMEFVISRIVRIFRESDGQLLAGNEKAVVLDGPIGESFYAEMRSSRDMLLYLSQYFAAFEDALRDFAENPSGIMSASAAHSFIASAARMRVFRAHAKYLYGRLAHARDAAEGRFRGERFKWRKYAIIASAGGSILISLLMVIFGILILGALS